MGGGLANLLIVDPGAVFDGTVDGGAGSTSTIELASGGAGVLQGLGSQYINFSQVIVDPGATWTLAGDNTLGAGITLAAGATLEIAGTVASGETIVFAGNGAELVVDSTASMAGSVTNFVPGETIDLRGVDYGQCVVPGHGQLDYTAPGGGNTSFPLSLGAGGTVQAVTDNNGGADVTALCFCAGTRLATPGGEVPVEQLAVGDMVLTASGDGAAYRVDRCRPRAGGARQAQRGDADDRAQGRAGGQRAAPRPARHQGACVVARWRADPGRVPGQPPLDHVGRSRAGSGAVPRRAGRPRCVAGERRAGGELSRRRQSLAVRQRQ